MTLHRALKALAALYLVGLIVAVMAYKAEFVGLMFSNPFFGVYSVCVASYILSRFLFSLFYRSKPDAGIEPPTNRNRTIRPTTTREGANTVPVEDSASAATYVSKHDQSPRPE